MSRLGLIGFPIAHSRSPQIFTALARQLQQPISYAAWRTPPEKLTEVVMRLKAEKIDGFNVTIPHKETIIPLLDRLTPAVHAIGAVNTVRFRRGRSEGHNTDAAGLNDALRAHGARIAGNVAVVFGAGGAARAALWTLGRARAKKVYVIARRPTRALTLVKLFNLLFRGTSFCVPKKIPRTARIWINATPLGMKGFPNVSPVLAVPPDALAFDMVYGQKTEFLRTAQACGACAVDGSSMLVYQALRAWEFWSRPLGAACREVLAHKLLKEAIWD